MQPMTYPSFQPPIMWLLLKMRKKDNVIFVVNMELALWVHRPAEYMFCNKKRPFLLELASDHVFRI